MACTSLFLNAPAEAAQGIPYRINFQGRLTDNNGNILADGSYNIKFRIFDAATSGTNLWEGDRVYGASDHRVAVTNGLFSIQLGDTTAGDPALSPTIFNTSSLRYLEIELPSTATNGCATNGCASFTEGPFTPRHTIGASPYAFVADTLDGLDSTDFGQITAANSFTGTNTFAKSGGAGIVLSGSPASSGSLLQLGSALSSGNVSGTLIGANGAFAGDLLNLQVSNATKLRVDNSGNLTLASGAAITVGASAGSSTTCSGGQFLQNQTTVGGIVTGGTCAAAGGGGDLQAAYTASSSPATISLNTSAKDFVVTATDQATDPNILFKLQCTTCSAGAGRFAVQDNGTDVFAVNPVGSIVVSPTAGQNLTLNLAAGSQFAVAASAAPTVDQVSISNSGQAVATAGVSGLQINYVGGAGAIEASGARVDLTPGSTSGATWSGIRVAANATGAASGVHENGLKLDGPSSPGAGTETAVYIGTGWDTGLDIQSGAVNMAGIEDGSGNPSDPSIPAADNLKIYAKKVAGRMLLKGIGPSGVDYPYQPALFQQAISYQSPLTGSTVSSVGQTWTVDATASTPAVSEIFGFGTNFATAATAADTTGVAENAVGHYRGSVAGGANGFFYVARLGLPDASYGSGSTGARIWTGLTSGTAASMVGSDNPSGDYAGFQYSTNRGDTTWQFITKNSTTQGGPTAATGITFAQNKAYDFYIYVAPLGSTIYWRVDNLTDGQTVEGNTATNLPRTTIAMRAGTSLETLTTTARNIRVLKHYVEADR